MSLGFTISDLKKNLGPGLGLRKNKYLLEIPVPASNGKKLNILCQSTSLPERTLGTVEVWNKGRKYKMRAETNFPSEYNISILDDSKMTLRAIFDKWLTLVDDTKPKNGGFLGATGGSSRSSYEADTSGFAINGNTYWTDINIWQLDNTNKKVYGYTLQNAYPISLGTVELDDNSQSDLSQFSVNFAYSEFIPLKGN